MTLHGLCVKTFPTASVTDLEPKYRDKTRTWGDSTKRGKSPLVAGGKTRVKISQKKIHGSKELELVCFRCKEFCDNGGERSRTGFTGVEISLYFRIPLDVAEEIRV